MDQPSNITANDNCADCASILHNSSSARYQKMTFSVPVQSTLQSASNNPLNIEQTTEKSDILITTNGKRRKIAQSASQFVSTRIPKSQSSSLIEATSSELERARDRQIFLPVKQDFIQQVSNHESTHVILRHPHFSQQPANGNAAARPLTVAISNPTVAQLGGRRASHPSYFFGRNSFHHEHEKHNANRTSALMGGISAREVQG